LGVGVKLRATIHKPYFSECYAGCMLPFLCAIALAHQASSANSYQPSGPQIEVVMKKGGRFVITTDPSRSPQTVAHIIDLVTHKFYDSQRVHRVEYWVTQWGDPASKTKPMNDPKMGDGDSGHRLPFEMSDIDFNRGIVGIASDGLQNGGDSQLFVIKKDRLYLYHSYAVLGKVTSGMDVVDKIDKGDWIASMRVLHPKIAAAFQGVPYVWRSPKSGKAKPSDHH
jgi:cyclophilin family peptidyl-prolyl cis-trans isomerase